MNSNVFYESFVVSENRSKLSTTATLGPSISASNLAQLIAEQGKLPDMPIRGVNSSYVVTLPGPALECTKSTRRACLVSGVDYARTSMIIQLRERR